MQARVQKAVSFSKNYIKSLKLVWQISPLYTSLTALTVILASLIPATQTYLAKLIIDRVVGIIGQSIAFEVVQPILILVLWAFILNFVEWALKDTQNFFSDLLTDLTLNRINVLVLEKAVGLDLSFFENSEFYDKLEKIRRESNHRPIRLLFNTFDLLEYAITAFSMFALLLSFGWIVLLLLAFVSIPRFFYNIAYSHKKYFITDSRVPESRKSSYISWLLSSDRSIKEVKLFALGKHFLTEYQKLFRKFYTENKNLSLRRDLGDFALGGLSSLAFYFSFGFFVWQTILQRFTIGDLTLYHRAFQSASSNFSLFLSRLSDVYEHNLYLKDLFEFLATEPKIINVKKSIKMPLSITQGIEFKNVSFKYPDAKNYAIKDINLFINPNESIALVGRNGAGKTTLVKLLTRLYEPTKGEILIDGIDYRKIDLTELRRAIGVIFQDFVSYQNKAKENIGFGDIKRLQKLPEIIKAAKKSGADKVIENLPEKYDTLLGKQFEGGHELSWGEWQKIALARGFFRDAQILVLDEPTASLDAEAEYNLYKKFAQLAKDRVVVLISHRFSTVRVAQKIYVLDKGKLIEQGTHEELLMQGSEYARLFTMQAEGYK